MVRKNYTSLSRIQKCYFVFFILSLAYFFFPNIVKGGASSLSFNTTYESDFIQEDATNGTDFNSGSVTLHEGSNGIISYWKFDDGTANDSMGRNHGTDMGTSSTTGKVGSARYFDGSTNAYISIGDKSDFDNLTTNFSIEYWFNGPDTNYTFYRPTVTKQWRNSGSDMTSGFALGYSNYSKDNVPFIINNKVLETPDFSIIGGNWYHVVATYDGNNMKIYLNGQERASTQYTTAMTPNNDPLEIGARSDSSSYRFLGTIDEVAIFNRALTPEEIGVHYNRSSDGQGYPTAAYPTSQSYYLTTSNTSQLLTSSWTAITGITTYENTPSNTSVKYLVSFDGRVTWKYWNGSSWQTSSLEDFQAYGMSKATLEGITEANWASNGGFSPGITTTLDIAVDLATTDSTVTPSISNCYINYTEGEVNSYTITPPINITPLLASDWLTDTSISGQTGTQAVGLVNDIYRIAVFDVEYSTNLDWSSLIIDSDGTKAVFHYPGGFSALPGASGEGYTLYIPKGTSIRVAICPNAASLEEITSVCPGRYYLDEYSPNVSIAIEDGIEYWKVSGLTSTGGEGEDPSLTFSIADVGAYTVTNGITTNVASTFSLLPFGDISPHNPKYLAHQLSVTTNAPGGYTVNMKLLNYLQGYIPANKIDPFAAPGVTWSSPQTWSSPTSDIPNVSTGWIGANTSDTRVEGWSDGAGKFGPVSTLPYPVMYSSGPDTSGTTVYVTYALEVNNYQPTDLYAGTLIYTIIPVY